MISVSEALTQIFSRLSPLEAERVPLRDAAGRVLAERVTATRAQPPFAASIMDGYGVPETAISEGDRFQVIGEAAAGRAFPGAVAPGQAVRIFTGAPVPDGVQRVVLQEDVSRGGETIVVGAEIDSSIYIRDLGADFNVGDTLKPPIRLSAAHVALLAAMNVPTVTVTRRPVVALIATGDELVMPGETPADEQIIASSAFGLAAMLDAAGAIPRILPIARDTRESLDAIFNLAADVDLVITIGGASVGDHDLVGAVAEKRGMDRAFHRVAMRPGKPLMSGTLDGIPMIGLPGNPVSSMVCGEIFIRPAIDVLLGLPAQPRHRATAHLLGPLASNGPREHYMRATLTPEGVQAHDRQDSALLSVLADSNALIVRPPHEPARDIGDTVEVVTL